MEGAYVEDDSRSVLRVFPTSLEGNVLTYLLSETRLATRGIAASPFYPTPESDKLNFFMKFP